MGMGSTVGLMRLMGGGVAMLGGMMGMVGGCGVGGSSWWFWKLEEIRFELLKLVFEFLRDFANCLQILCGLTGIIPGL